MKTEQTELPIDPGPLRQTRPSWQMSLRDFLWLTTVAVLLIGYVWTYRRLQHSESELASIRRSTGYLGETASDQVAAIRAPSEQPLTYRIRVRIPERPKYRVAYSSVWEKEAAKPNWFAAVQLPEGDSLVIVRIMKDPRDDRWKISTLVQAERGTKRIATVLPQAHIDVFRRSHDAISAGVGRETTAVAKSEPLRILDERWLVGEDGLLLYGNRPPSSDLIGVFAEIQPDSGPL